MNNLGTVKVDKDIISSETARFIGLELDKDYIIHNYVGPEYDHYGSVLLNNNMGTWYSTEFFVESFLSGQKI